MNSKDILINKWKNIFETSSGEISTGPRITETIMSSKYPDNYIKQKIRMVHWTINSSFKKIASTSVLDCAKNIFDYVIRQIFPNEKMFCITSPEKHKIQFFKLLECKTGLAKNKRFSNQKEFYYDFNLGLYISPLDYKLNPITSDDDLDMAYQDMFPEIYDQFEDYVSQKRIMDKMVSDGKYDEIIEHANDFSMESGFENVQKIEDNMPTYELKFPYTRLNSDVDIFLKDQKEDGNIFLESQFSFGIQGNISQNNMM